MVVLRRCSRPLEKLETTSARLEVCCFASISFDDFTSPESSTPRLWTLKSSSRVHGNLLASSSPCVVALVASNLASLGTLLLSSCRNRSETSCTSRACNDTCSFEEHQTALSTKLRGYCATDTSQGVFMLTTWWASSSSFRSCFLHAFLLAPSGGQRRASCATQATFRRNSSS